MRAPKAVRDQGRNAYRYGRWTQQYGAGSRETNSAYSESGRFNAAFPIYVFSPSFNRNLWGGPLRTREDAGAPALRRMFLLLLWIL